MSKRPWRPSSLIRPVSPPTPDSRPYVPQLVPRAGKVTELLAVHLAVVWYHVHFLNKRTKPCAGNAILCDGCSQGLAQRWEGYLGAVGLADHRVWVLKVTAGAWINSDTLQANDGKLRGMQLRCSRLGKSDNSALRIEVFDAQRTVKLPPVWNINDTLARLWGYSHVGPIIPAEGINLGSISHHSEEQEGGEE